MSDKKYILIFNGNPRSGKTQCQLFLKDLVSSQYGEDIFIVSTVDIIKKAAKILGWKSDEFDKSEKARKFLSDLKMSSTEFCDHSYNYIKYSIEEFFQYSNAKILCIDSREIIEIERFKKDFKAKTIIVKNPNVLAITSNIADADANRIDYKYDFIINNNGTLDDLKIKVKKFLIELEKGENNYE